MKLVSLVAFIVIVTEWYLGQLHLLGLVWAAGAGVSFVAFLVFDAYLAGFSGDEYYEDEEFVPMPVWWAMIWPWGWTHYVSSILERRK